MKTQISEEKIKYEKQMVLQIMIETQELMIAFDVLHYWRDNKNLPFDEKEFEEIQNESPTMLQNIRSRMSELKIEGKLIKTEKTKIGDFGKSNHFYVLSEKYKEKNHGVQGKLF